MRLNSCKNTVRSVINPFLVNLTFNRLEEEIDKSLDSITTSKSRKFIIRKKDGNKTFINVKPIVFRYVDNVINCKKK